MHGPKEIIEEAGFLPVLETQAMMRRQHP